MRGKGRYLQNNRLFKKVKAPQIQNKRVYHDFTKQFE